MIDFPKELRLGIRMIRMPSQSSFRSLVLPPSFSYCPCSIVRLSFRDDSQLTDMIILDINLHRRIFKEQGEGLRIPKISSLITWPTELKFCRMMLGNGAHNRSVPDIAGSAVEACLLKSSIFISLITWPTKLKLFTMILDIGANSRSVPDFAISSHEALWGRVFCKIQIDSQPTVLIRLS